MKPPISLGSSLSLSARVRSFKNPKIQWYQASRCSSERNSLNDGRLRSQLIRTIFRTFSRTLFELFTLEKSEVVHQEVICCVGNGFTDIMRKSETVHAANFELRFVKPDNRVDLGLVVRITTAASY
jgi:hypothetical protein